MKTKLLITLTALLMLICVGATAQSESALNGYNGKPIVSNVGGIASAIMNGSYQSETDQNGDNKVNAVDIVRFVNMTSVNIRIKNSTSAAISLSPRIKFVLKNKSTDAAWFGAVGSTIIINSNETKEYNNVLIPNSRTLIGQVFANSSELDGLSSNVVLYDTPANGWNSTTIIPEMVDPSVTFAAGGTYEINIGSNGSSDPTPVNPPPTDNVTATVTIVNNSGAAKTFDGKICFVTYGSHPTDDYTGHFTWVGTCNGSDFTIANGAQKTYTVTFAKDNSQTPSIGLNQPFANAAQLASSGYSANNGLYISSSFTPCTSFDVGTTFTQGGTYTMTIPGSGSTVDPTPTPTTDDVTTTVTIVNNSGVAKTFDGKICFVTYGSHPTEDYTGMFSWKGTCTGNGFTIPAGGSQTYTVTFAKDNSQTPTIGLNQPFAASNKLGSYSANNGYYVNNIFTPCTNFSTSTTFTQGGTYTMTIPGSGSTVDPTPTTGDVTTTVTIVNNSGIAKTFDGKVCFITYGKHPNENYTGYFRFKGTCAAGSNLTIPAGGSRTYTITFAKDNTQTPSVGLGHTFATQAQRGQFQSNNGYYIGGSCYTCTDFSTNDTFRNGGTYTMTIPANTHEWTSTSVDPTPTTGDVTTTVTIVNNSGVAKTFDGKVCFITYGKHPNENYTGYFRFKGTCAAGSNLTIPAGGSRTYTITFAKDNTQTPSVGLGHTFATQAQRGQFQSNNGYYIGGSCYTCTDFSTNDTFRNGGTYTMTIPANTHEWTSTSVDPTPTTGDVTTTVTIVNNSGVAKTFDGKVCFITYGKHPNENYTGYFRFKGTCAAGSNLTIPAGGSRTYTITFAKDNTQTPSVGLGHTFATQAQRGQFQSNNGYYIGGSCYTCTDFSTNDTFRNGGTYTMTIPANTHEWTSTSVDPTPTTGDVTTTVTIVNNSGVAKTFDGKVCFITYGKHPNENYTGYFRFKGTCAAGSNLTIPAGGSRTYTITFAKDNTQTPSVGLGHTFATQAQRGQFQSNNGYYIGGSCYTCTDFSTNDTFRNGGTYTMTIPTNTHEWSSN